jgi:uncharacterized protein (TIGR02246 family)
MTFVLRRIWILLLAILAICAAFFGLGDSSAKAAARADRNTDQAAIASVLTAQVEAWNRGDVDAFLEGYWKSPDVSFSGTSGITRGWDGVRERYKKNYADRTAMGELDFSGLEFRFLGNDAALVLGHWHLKREKGDIGGVFSLVWQKFPEGWKIIHDHTSQAPTP